MTNEEMLKADLERAVKELGLNGSNTKQRVKYLLEECLEVYFKPKKYLTYDDIMKLEAEKVENGIRSSIVYKVKLNGHIYNMRIVQYLFTREVILDTDKSTIFEYFLNQINRQFINDLHLELVEE